MVTALIAALVSTQGSEADLGRVFKAGDHQEYSVASTLVVEERSRGLQTWLPESLKLAYNFTIDVKALKADGIAELRYQRPTMTETRGETADSPPVTKVEKANFDLQLDVSPMNEILSVKDLAKKDDKKKTGGGRWVNSAGGREAILQDLGAYVGEIYRLSLFAGSFDSALDFSPKLPFEKVAPGATWKKTVGYSPQKLGGKGKSAVQRLDYTFTYAGMVTVGAKKYQRVTANLDLKTDLAAFLHESTGLTPDQTGLKEWPLTLQATIDFDLDPVTRNTVKAVARSEGGFKVITADFPDSPAQEQKLHGETILKRVK